MYRPGPTAPILGLAVGLGSALVLGVLSEWAVYSWDEPQFWLPDLVVGLVWIACGLRVWNANRGTAALSVAVGVTWFLGGVVPGGLGWHRGPLVHLLVAYPGSRPRTRPGRVAVGIGYLVAIVPSLWRNNVLTIVLAVALVAVVVHERVGSVGRTRRRRTRALQATVVLAAVLVTAAVLRMTPAEGATVLPILLTYEAVLCGIAVALTLDLGRTGSPAVTDLVVELGETTSGTLRDTLARVLGDPSLRLGYWSDDAHTYLDDRGSVVRRPGPTRTATAIASDGHPLAVLVHDPAVLADPALVEAIGTATRLTASNVALQAEVRGQVDELTASRRRLVVAADEERARLVQRLEHGAEHHLQTVLARLRTAFQDPPDEHVARAIDHLDRTLAELHELARGLHPRELADGLRPALVAVAEASAVPVRLTVTDARFPTEVEVAAYFACTEALANVAKHAEASSASVDVSRQDGQLVMVIADNGTGGANPSGTGLTGIADRLAAFGGRLTVDSRPATGTRLTLTIPTGTTVGEEP
ncbi:hypothetical protein FB561_7592 [Kribbella amoyensis]|uniref:histidine kinase n=1 Tax=Kribbella amoyensis TaxID=996641 RepID=A0A561AZG6_9ACTN|nr:ATP-binding protein [Kribbella amoyensis]TWD72015.1 hypothetical protein FB561_7592 [Kribbella amoyensis]